MARGAESILYGPLAPQASRGDWDDLVPGTEMTARAERLAAAVRDGQPDRALTIVCSHRQLAQADDRPLLDTLYSALAETAVRSAAHGDGRALAELESLTAIFEADLRRRVAEGEADNERLLEADPLKLSYRRRDELGATAAARIEALRDDLRLAPFSAHELRLLVEHGTDTPATSALFDLLCDRLIEAVQGPVRHLYGRPADDGWLSITDRFSEVVVRIRKGSRRRDTGRCNPTLLHIWDYANVSTVCGTAPSRYRPARVLRGSWAAAEEYDARYRRCRKCERLAAERDLLPSARAESLRRYQVLASESEEALRQLARSQLTMALQTGKLPVSEADDDEQAIRDIDLARFAEELLGVHVPAVVASDLISFHPNELKVMAPADKLRRLAERRGSFEAFVLWAERDCWVRWLGKALAEAIPQEQRERRTQIREEVGELIDAYIDAGCPEVTEA